MMWMSFCSGLKMHYIIEETHILGQGSSENKPKYLSLRLSYFTSMALSYDTVMCVGFTVVCFGIKAFEL